MANFDAKIDLKDPSKSYKDIIKNYLDNADNLTEEEYRDRFTEIAKMTRETIWNLLFESCTGAVDNRCEKAGALLKEHKKDAAFFAPDDYNDYIVTVRDELLKREMLDFWRNVMVPNELGPCWARDSDYFDDMYDTKPAQFYEFAGCKAPFEPWKDEAEVTEVNNSVISSTNAEANKNTCETVLSEIGFENPVANYKAIINSREDDQNAVKELFKDVQKVIWELLFKEDHLSDENSDKAGSLLMEYRKDACFFYPFYYNSWIRTVRDKLFEKKYYDFWRFIVVNKLGLCSHEDSDYFDDSTNTDHIEFLKSGGDDKMSK